MRSSMSSGMRVTLEPFASSTPASEPIFLTANGNLATPSPSPSPAPYSTPTPTNLTRDASFGSGSSGSGTNYNKMDTTDTTTPLENTRSGSNAPGAHPKPSKEDKADSAAAKEKDSKYLEQFLQSMSHLPDFVTEKMSKIKGIDKAITQKSQAIKEASAYHVQMIHAKLTPPKKSDDSAAGGATPSSSPISSTSSPMDLSPSGSSSSFAASSPSSSSSSSLPPLPTPSPLTPPLPYTLTPSVIQPLATENLFNSLTYLLVGPVVHQSSMLSNGATTIAQQQSAGNNSISVSKQDMGIMPMHISPASYPPVGKKLSSTAAQAFAHPFASIPSPMELQSTAVTPVAVEPPATLSNDLLDFRKRFPNPADYDLDQAEKTMKEHHAQIIEWQKSKSIYVNELFDQLDQLAKRADISVKKYDLKLRRGNFEVPATPIDRRRVTGAGTTTTGGVDSRKRSYSTMVHELESRELQYALQNELRLEIEKQSANALTTHSTAGVNASTGASGSTSPQAEPNEPVYCICKKVSFGAMVACDNEDCEIEWFHFACVQLDTKPKGKWLCPDCRKKKKKAAAESGGDKDKESSNTSSNEKEKEKDKKDSSEKGEKESSSTAASKEKDKDKEKEKEKDKDKDKHDDDKPEKAEKHSKKEKHDKHDKHEKGEKHEKHEKKEKHDKSDKEKEKHKDKSEHHEKKQKKEK